MNALDADHVFNLPELTQQVARHLPQGSLYQCIQVSKTWHAMFISQLWRTYSDEPKLGLSFGGGIIPPKHDEWRCDRLKWFEKVFSQHAKYIRHLTISRPITLDGILKDAFVQRQSPSPEATLGGQVGEAYSGLAAASTSSTACRSVVTNLVSLTLTVIPGNLIAYFDIYRNNNAIGTGDNNGQNHGATTDGPIAVSTAAPVYIRPHHTPHRGNYENSYISACLRLILCNPRLQTLSCANFPQFLQSISSTSPDGTLLPAFKNLSIVSADGLIPAQLPLSVTKLTVAFPNWPNFGSARYPSNHEIVHTGLETLVTHHVESGTHLQALLAVVPSLKTLSIHSSASVFYRGPNTRFSLNNNEFGQLAGLTAAGIPAHPPPPSLDIDKSSWPVSKIKVLRTTQPSFSYSTATLLDNMLSSFPHLVEFYGVHEWFPTIATQLCQSCPLIEIIQIRQKSRGVYSSNVHYGSVSASFAPDIRSVRNSHNLKLPPRTLQDMVDDDVSMVLSTLKRLRVLDIPFATIKAENAGDQEKPWVCLGLQIFRCQIVGVPFLTEKQEQRVLEICRREIEAGEGEAQRRTDEEEGLMALSNKRVSTIYKVMTQLSKLTSLKYLSLSPDLKIGKELFVSRFDSGTPLGEKIVYKSPRDGKTYIRYDDVLPDTLHLRLDHGLSQLASLTHLQYLGFESMDHRMDTAEIEWIAKAFPRLRGMRGLLMDGFVGMEPNPKNEALLELMRTLRPDVVQLQSFGGYEITGGSSEMGTRRR